MVQLISFLLCLAVMAACFFPWVHIESRDITYGGFYSNEGTYGKPGLFHVILCALVALFILIGKVWSIRAAFFISMINIAWAIRNFFLLSACRGGICPEKQEGLYIVLIASILTTITLLFINPKQKQPSI